MSSKSSFFQTDTAQINFASSLVVTALCANDSCFCADDADARVIVLLPATLLKYDERGATCDGSSSFSDSESSESLAKRKS